MAIETKQFDSYSIRHYSKLSGAAIDCYSGSNPVGEIEFHEDDAAIPDNTMDGRYGGFLMIHFPLNRFDDVVTILRQEKPLFLSLNTNNQIGWLGTQEKEPVGEEES